MRAEGVNTAHLAGKILREEIMLLGRQRSPSPCEVVVDLGGKGKKTSKNLALLCQETYGGFGQSCIRDQHSPIQLCKLSERHRGANRVWSPRSFGQFCYLSGENGSTARAGGNHWHYKSDHHKAAEYSNIGINRLTEMVNNSMYPFVLNIGKKKMIKRKEFEKYT